MSQNPPTQLIPILRTLDQHIAKISHHYGMNHTIYHKHLPLVRPTHTAERHKMLSDMHGHNEKIRECIQAMLCIIICISEEGSREWYMEDVVLDDVVSVAQAQKTELMKEIEREEFWAKEARGWEEDLRKQIGKFEDEQSEHNKKSVEGSGKKAARWKEVVSLGRYMIGR